MEGLIILGAIAWLLIESDVKVRLQGGISVGVNPDTGLPINTAGGSPGAQTARAGMAQGLPTTEADMPILIKTDVLDGQAYSYGRYYGNTVKSPAGYTPPIMPKYKPYEDDMFNSAADNNGGYVIGSGYR